MPRRVAKPLVCETKARKNKTKENGEDSVTIFKPMRWNLMEIDKLKIALKMAVNPQTEADWATIAKFVGRHNLTDCQRKAAELNLKTTETVLSPTLSKKKSRDGLRWKANKKVANSDEKPKRKTELVIELSPKMNNDFFADKTEMDSPLELDPNDSILYAMLTPREKIRFPRRPLFLSKITYEKLSTNNESNNVSDDNNN